MILAVRSRVANSETEKPRAIPPGNRPCQNWVAVKESSQGLVGAKELDLIVGRFDADEKHIPFDVFTCGSRASPRERLVQHFEVSDLIDFRQKPVGQTAAATAGDLPAQQLDRAFENPVVMRFGNAILAVIGKSNDTRVLDGRPEQRMRLQQHS